MAKKITDTATSSRPYLKLYKEDMPASFMETMVHDFLKDIVKDGNINRDDAAGLSKVFDRFFDYCRDVAPNTVVVSEGKTLPLISS
jgi:hypothetical protein